MEGLPIRDPDNRDCSKKEKKVGRFALSLFFRGVDAIDSSFSVIKIVHLCPFCDNPLGPRELVWFEDLPTTTPETLTSLYGAAWPKSRHSPRATNRNGRESRDETASAACRQHMYETMILPLSVQYQWPRNIDFSSFLVRIKASHYFKLLQKVFKSPWTSVLLGVASAAEKDRSQLQTYDMSKLSLLYTSPGTPLPSAG